MNNHRTRSAKAANPSMANASSNRSSSTCLSNNQSDQVIVLFFGKRPEDVREQNRILPPAKQRSLPQIAQKSPIDPTSVANLKRYPQTMSIKKSLSIKQSACGQDGNEFDLSSWENQRSSSQLTGNAQLADERQDYIDLQIKDDRERIGRDIHSGMIQRAEPRQYNESCISGLSMNQGKQKRRNFRDILDGDEQHRLKTVEDEQNEIINWNKEARDQMESLYMNSQLYHKANGARQRRYRSNQKKDEDVVFQSEAEVRLEKRLDQGMSQQEAQQNIQDNGDSDSDFSDKMDEMEDDDLLKEERNKDNKYTNEITKKSALDRAGDVDTANLNTRQDEADDTVFIDNLPKDEQSLRTLIENIDVNIRVLEQQFFEEEDSDVENELKDGLNQQDISDERHNKRLEQFTEKSYIQQFWSIPMSDNVTEFDWKNLADQQRRHGGRLFDVITCDPPWQLSTANPTRGVAIAYSSLSDRQVMDIPFDKLQDDGFLFVWVINAKYRFAISMMEHYGYSLVDEIAWVKQTVNGKIAKGHGYYLQHAKETCLIGAKGSALKSGHKSSHLNVMTDLIFSQRRGQSQKPNEIYATAESVMPNGYYLEIFGRRNNLQNGWVTIGNEL